MASEIVEFKEENTDKGRLIIRFSKPYNFEDNTYTEVDLSGIDELTTTDLCKAQNLVEKKILSESQTVPVNLETNYEFAIILAAKAASLPIEFFERLPAKEGRKVKTAITQYFFTED